MAARFEETREYKNRQAALRRQQVPKGELGAKARAHEQHTRTLLDSLPSLSVPIGKNLLRQERIDKIAKLTKDSNAIYQSTKLYCDTLKKQFGDKLRQCYGLMQQLNISKAAYDRIVQATEKAKLDFISVYDKCYSTNGTFSISDFDRNIYEMEIFAPINDIFDKLTLAVSRSRGGNKRKDTRRKLMGRRRRTRRKRRMKKTKRRRRARIK